MEVKEITHKVRDIECEDFPWRHLFPKCKWNKPELADCKECCTSDIKKYVECKEYWDSILPEIIAENLKN